MKIIDLKCPHCGAKLQVNDEMKKATCNYCGQAFVIDDEVQHIQYDNAEQAGYDFERGRQRAQDERRVARRQESNAPRPSSRQAKKKKSPAMICLLVFLWLCFFPIMLSIWIWKTNRIPDKKIKYICLAVLWALTIIIWVTTDSSSTKGASDQATTVSTESIAEEIPSEDTETLPVIYDGDDKINRFLNAYNDANVDDIESTDFNVYHHHGKDHTDQIRSLDSGSETVISSTPKGIKVYLDRGSMDEYKDAFFCYARAFDSSLDDETLEGYWEQIEDSGQDLKVDQFEVDTTGYGDAYTHMTIEGPIK